jgi:hypothetical protein
MSGELRGQIYENMNLKETDELLDIWETNDQVEWSDEAFAVVEEILKARIGNLPAQNEPILEHDDEEIIDDDDLEDWEGKLLDDENQPEFYSTLEVISLNDNINKTAKAVIVVNGILALWYFQTFRKMVIGIFPTIGDIPGILTSLLIVALSVGLQIALTYFPLKALGHILRILMQMEFNSRKA